MNSPEIKTIKKTLKTYDTWFSEGNNLLPEQLNFEIRKDGQILYYFAGNHSNDPNNEQFARLDEYFNKFQKETGEKKIAFVTEQDFKLDNITSKEQAIQNLVGEMGYSLFIAKENGIETFNFEPSEMQLVNELLNEFSKEEIFYYTVAKWLHWWNLGGRKSPFSSKVVEVMEDIEKTFGWKGFEFSWANFEQIHKGYFETELNHEDTEFFGNITKPTVTDTTFNLICREESQSRDAHILSGILDLWSRGYSLFVVYGSGHAFVQKPALETLI